MYELDDTLQYRLKKTLTEYITQYTLHVYNIKYYKHYEPKP